jgi:outer membrane protein OmpA-like peptidoglycan-associated protein
MAGGSSEGEVNHWPAFVDVLTTVIMVVTFLLVIMSSAVMMLSQRVIKQMQLKAQHEGQSTAPKVPAAAQGTPIRSPAEAADGSSIAQKGAILQMESPPDGQERLSIRTRESKETLKLAVKAVEEPKEAKGVEVKTADMLLSINFEPAAVNYDEATTKKVIDFLRAHPNPGLMFEIWSFAPQTGSISEAQRLAFYRAAMTRNLLVRSGISTKQINTQIRITDPKLPDGHNVRVVIKP